MKNRTLTFLFFLFAFNIIKAQDKPNVIYILVDDMGYSDLGCFGSKLIQTPNLDKMSQKGMKCTTHYTVGVCAPSRAALMTGKDMGHCEIRGNKQWPTGGQKPLSDSAVTVAQLFKKEGYATALIGKWGLGNFGTSGDPNKKGFDLAYGYVDQVRAHNSFPEYLLRNGKKEYLRNEVQYMDTINHYQGASISTKKVDFSQDLFTKEALNFIETNNKKPFFIYLTYVIPHDNGEAPDGQKMEVPTTEPYTSKDWSYEDKCYAASITYMDKDVGKILALLSKLNLDKNTLVIFTSDNGPKQIDRFESAKPFRGIKRDLYEGGIRTPFIAQWTGKIKANSVSEAPITLWDFMPTAAEMLKVKSPNTNGISYLPLLLGQKEKPRDFIYFEIHDGGNKQAVRMGNWKAVRKNIVPGKPLPPVEIYNLEKDISESSNVADTNPEILSRMVDIMKNYPVADKNWPLY